MHSMHEALAREHKRELESQARSYRLSRSLASARRRPSYRHAAASRSRRSAGAAPVSAVAD